jgi:hypothetical protein
MEAEWKRKRGGETEAFCFFFAVGDPIFAAQAGGRAPNGSQVQAEDGVAYTPLF